MRIIIACFKTLKGKFLYTFVLFKVISFLLGLTVYILRNVKNISLRHLFIELFNYIITLYTIEKYLYERFLNCW